MKPTLVLVGRPNVGKSTLFNRLTRTRDAIVADIPGLTRDRHYGHGRVGDKPYLVMDTGGFEPVVKEGILHAMAKQTLQAIDEADKVLFIVDGRQGVTAHDKIIAEQLRKSGKNILLVVNKTEGMAIAVVTAEFYELGLGEPCAVSAMHGDHIKDLAEWALADFPETEEESPASKHPKNCHRRSP
jgi:GTP-binding protein